VANEVSPGEGQQETSLQEVLETSYDELETTGPDEDIQEHDDAEVEVSAEDDTQEVEADAELEEGTQEVEEIDYNEAAPDRWPEEYKEYYNKLDAKGKQIFLDGLYKPMQRTYTEKTQQMAEQRKRLEPMLKTLEQHSGDFEQAGINPVEAFNRQMAWSAHFAKVGPEQGAKDLAKAYGQAGQQTEQDDSQTAYMTPVERAQQARLEKIEQRFQDQERQRQEQAESAALAARQRQQETVQSSIAQFANEVRDGKPAHPHVEKVSARMAGLIKGGIVQRTNEYGQPRPYNEQLSDAYEMACRLDPSISTARNTRTRKEQVARVSAASRDVVSKTPGSDVDVEPAPLLDELSDLYDKLDRSA
jgi:hypothetical protein